MRFPEDVPVLTDGRVTLRAHRMGDLDAITDQCQDPEMQRFTVVPVPYTRDNAMQFVTSRAEAWKGGTEHPFAVEAPGGAGPTRFAGSIDLRIKGPGIAGLGFGGHPAARGHGIMTAALRLVANWAFAQQQVQRLQWACIAGNLASWRVAWHNGFRFEGTTRRSQPRRGDLLDSWHASLLATDDREPKTRWLDQPTLTDGRVTLRPLAAADEHRFLETVLDPESHCWLADIPLPRDAESFRARVRTSGLAPSLGQAVEWAITDTATDEYVGGLNLFGLGGLDHRSAEVGYRAHPGARGRGHVSAALRLVLAQAFAAECDGGYGLRRVSLGAADSNNGSQAVARACGFTETGRDRRCYRLATTPWSTWCASISSPRSGARDGGRRTDPEAPTVVRAARTSHVPSGRRSRRTTSGGWKIVNVLWSPR